MSHLIYPRVSSFAVVALCAMLISPLVAISRGGKTSSTSYGTISQIVQTRNHRKSCWGVVIHLKKLHFKRSISAAEPTITEAKHSSDLRPLMAWNVTKSNRTLTIEFKQGMGDFGTGNYTTIHIDSTAVVGSPKGGLEFSISTDLESQKP